MIKFKTGLEEDGTRALVGLGLTEENFTKLKEGKPIHIKGSELAIDFDILIFYGKTEFQILKDLKPFINKSTSVEGLVLKGKPESK